MSDAAPVPDEAVDATFKLAKFASGLRFDDLPADVVAKAKFSILDTLGCCIFGASLGPMQKLARVVEGEGAAPKATAFGYPFRTSASLAALINGTGAHSFQLDEIHLESTLHPASIGLAAAFALAEGDQAATGRDLITALVAANEVGIRIGLACKGGMFKTGFHNQGTTGVFVAGAAAGKMLRLEPKQMQHALGIAGSQAAGLMAVQDGAMTKAFHSGRAAQSGVYAGNLARLGYTGIPDVLEAPYGAFFSSFVDEWSPQALTAQLGSRWETLRIGFKPAPASNGSITAMMAMERIIAEHKVAAGDIETITAYVSNNTLHHCGWPYDLAHIQSVLSAQMNLRYGIAIVTLHRDNGVAQFNEEQIRAHEILKFIERIRVEHEPKFETEGGRYRVACRLAVTLKSGATLETEVLFRKGSPEDPMSETELRQKFSRLADSLGAERAERVAALVLDLDKASSLSELAALLAAP